MRRWFAFSIFLLLVFFSGSSCFAQQAANDITRGNSAVTTSFPNIPLDELAIMLTPLTSDELLVEADGWLALLKETVTQIAKEEVKIKRKNRLVKDKKEDAKESKGQSFDKEAADSIEKATEQKKALLEDMNALQTLKINRVDRLNTVLRAITEKIGLAEGGKEPEQVMPYRRYINAVGGVKVDTSDLYAAWVNLRGWLVSSEGGVRWLVNFLSFIVFVFVFWGLSRVIGKATAKALDISPSNSKILNNFIITSSRRLTIVVGILVGLSALEINVGPLVAIIGAAGFVVAFALQGTLSNFASGLMIMAYGPFDVGDLITVSGELGVVRSMNLVSTTLMTPDNKFLVIPNNGIWGNTITNATKSVERRIDMVFGIGYSDDSDRAKRVMDKILDDHPKVLAEPQPVVRLHELGDSSVNFVCRPWVKVEDYWEVYWDVTRQVKEHFDAEGISIPFPQRDVHLYREAD